MAEKEDDLTYDELHLAVKIFRVLYWVFAFSGLIWFIVMIVAVFRGFEWYFAIPIFIAGNIFLKICKKVCGNVVEGSREDIDYHERPFEN